MGFFATLAAKLTLDGTNFKANVRDAEKSVERFGKDTLGQLKGQIAGAFGAGAIIAFTQQVIEHAGRVKDLSEDYQLTTKRVQQLMAAFSGNDQKLQFTLSKLEKLNEMRRKAGENPSGDEAKALAKIGITAEMVNDPLLETDQLLENISDEALASRTAANEFFDVFGKGGQKMINIIDEIKKAKGKNMEWAISPEELEAIDEGVKRLEMAQLKSKSWAGKRVGEFSQHPYLAFLKNFTPLRPFLSNIDLTGAKRPQPATGSLEAPAPGDKEFIGPLPPRFENKALEQAKERALKAEAALQERIWTIEFKRAESSRQIAMLEEEKLKIVQQELELRRQLEDAKTDEERFRLRERLANLDIQRRDKEAEQEELKKKSQRGLSINDVLPITENKGVLTGGNVNIARSRDLFYNGLGGQLSGDTGEKQVEQTRQLVGVMKEAKNLLASIERKTMPFNGKF